VLAEANGAGNKALQVNGRAVFSRSGTAVIASGLKSVTVPLPGLTAASLVLAVLMNVTGAVVVQAVVPDVAGGTFTVFVNKPPKAPATATVAWFVVN
jgi:hypothetical protein